MVSQHDWITIGLFMLGWVIADIIRWGLRHYQQHRRLVRWAENASQSPAAYSKSEDDE